MRAVPFGPPDSSATRRSARGRPQGFPLAVLSPVRRRVISWNPPAGEVCLVEDSSEKPSRCDTFPSLVVRCARSFGPNVRRKRWTRYSRGIRAGVIGTVFMNLSSETEMHLRGRQPSVVPARAANKVLGIVGVPQLEGTALQVLSTWTHYLYGTAWGLVLWVLLSPLELSIAAALPLFFLIVWGTEQIELPRARAHPSLVEVGRQGGRDRSVASRRVCEWRGGELGAGRRGLSCPARPGRFSHPRDRLSVKPDLCCLG